MGVAGVAWATFLCQGISCILAMVVIFRRLAKIEGKEKAPFFDKKILMQIVVIAVPSTLQQSFISLGNIVIQSIINGFGAPVMAGYSAAVNGHHFFHHTWKWYFQLHSTEPGRKKNATYQRRLPCRC